MVHVPEVHLYVTDWQPVALDGAADDTQHGQLSLHVHRLFVQPLHFVDVTRNILHGVQGALDVRVIFTFAVGVFHQALCMCMMQTRG